MPVTPAPAALTSFRRGPESFWMSELTSSDFWLILQCGLGRFLLRVVEEGQWRDGGSSRRWSPHPATGSSWQRPEDCPTPRFIEEETVPPQGVVTCSGSPGGFQWLCQSTLI